MSSMGTIWAEMGLRLDKLDTGVKKAQAETKALGQSVQSTMDVMVARVDRAARDIDVALKVVEARWELQQRQMGETASKAQFLAAKQGALKEALVLVDQKVALLSSAYEKMRAAKGAAALETQQLYLELVKERTAQVDLAKSIDATTRELTSMQQAAARTPSLLQRISSAASTVGRVGASAFSTTASFVGGLITRVANLQNILIATATTGVAGLGVKFDAMLEQAQIAFTTMLGSAQRAKLFLIDLQRFAAVTPFEFPDLQNAARRMLALGFAANQILPSLRVVGDAVAAMGGSKEMIDRVVMSLGQIKTKGTVQAEELLQLAEAGIPAYQILQEKLGLTADQVRNIGQQGIAADTVISALLAGLNERYAGAMQQQSQTATGMFSTLKDNAMMLLGAVVEPLFNRIKQALPSITDAVTKVTAGFQDAGLRGAISNLFPPETAVKIIQALGTLEQAGAKVRDLMVAIWPQVQSVLAPVLDVLMALFTSIREVLPGLYQVFQRYLPPILTVVSKVFSALGPIVKTALGVVVDLIKFILAVLNGDWDKAWTSLKGAFSKAWKLIKDTIIFEFRTMPTIMAQLGSDIVNGLWNGLKSLTGWIISKVSAWISDVIPGPIKKVLGIASPSKLMDEYGQNVGEGLALGMDKTAPAVSASAKSLADVISERVEAATGRIDLALQILEARWDLQQKQMAANATQAQELTAKQAFLQQQLALVQEKVAALNTAYDQMKAAKGAAAEETQKLYLELLKEQAAQVDLQRSIEETTNALERQTKARLVSVDYEKQQAIVQMANGTYVATPTGITNFDYRTGQQTSDPYGGRPKDEINAIAQRQGVDIGTAAAMWDSNQDAIVEGKVPQYGRGGYVRRPTLALIGERGPEVVAPPAPLAKTIGDAVYRAVRDALHVARPDAPEQGSQPVILALDPLGLKRLGQALIPAIQAERIRRGEA